MKNRFGDVRAKGRMDEAKMLFYNFSVQVAELENTFHLVARVHVGTELMMEIQGTLVAFTYANVFRVYHKKITGKEP